MTIDEIYLKISQHVVNTIEAKWAIAIINAEINVGHGRFKCVYKEDESTDIDYDFDSSFSLFKAFESLHEITTKGGKKWTLAKFTLYPTGKFSIEFKWDQERTNEIASNAK